MTSPHRHIIRAAIASLTIILATACASDDNIAPQQPATQYLHMATTSVNMLKPTTAQRMPTRSGGDGAFVPGTTLGEEPEGVSEYYTYNQLYPLPINKDFTTIGTFMAEDHRNSYNTTSGYFKYENTDTWTTTIGIKPDTDYHIFGYMPSNTGSTLATINKRDGSTTWADGAKMKITNLPTSTPADVCILVGVLKAEVPEPKDDDWQPTPINDPTIVSQLRQGAYDYHTTATDNYVYMLLQHIYANINIELSIDPEYYKLRNIVLNDVFVTTEVPSLVDCDLTLGNNPKKPIENIQFKYAQNAELSTRTRLTTNEDHILLTPTPTPIPIYFSPYLPDQGFDYEFHYDVYDREGEDFSDPENPIYGNLVRQNCIAINHWRIHGFGVEAGKSFKADVKIRPTYLYMLSEPDLDNPTFELDTP